jgi:hypothetical protein
MSFVGRLEYGPDDYTQIRTHQIRVSNLMLLPENAKDNMRLTFGEAEGVFVVGCRSAEQSDEPNLDSFCQAFANTIGRTVHGAAHYFKVFQRQEDGNWDKVDLYRSDPAPPAHKPVVLVPGAKGGGQYIKYTSPKPLGLGRPDPTSASFPATEDLIALYQTMLSPCHPEED